MSMEEYRQEQSPEVSTDGKQSMIPVRVYGRGIRRYFLPPPEPVASDDYVIVRLDGDLIFGRVEGEPLRLDLASLREDSSEIVRRATEEDLAQHEANIDYELNAFRIGRAKIADHGLEMNLIDVELIWDHSRLVFYFTADGRVDFRELVKDLASIFRMRIDLRQIGVRDEARRLGALGICGRELCCSSFLRDFEPVSIKMAKLQNLSMNPTKISGACGRLLCCLKYEEEAYLDLRKRLPKRGDRVRTEYGEAIVEEVESLKERISVRLRGDEEGELIRLPATAVEIIKKR